MNSSQSPQRRRRLVSGEWAARIVASEAARPASRQLQKTWIRVAVKADSLQKTWIRVTVKADSLQKTWIRVAVKADSLQKTWIRVAVKADSLL